MGCFNNRFHFKLRIKRIIFAKRGDIFILILNTDFEISNGKLYHSNFPLGFCKSRSIIHLFEWLCVHFANNNIERLNLFWGISADFIFNVALKKNYFANAPRDLSFQGQQNKNIPTFLIIWTKTSSWQTLYNKWL